MNLTSSIHRLIILPVVLALAVLVSQCSMLNLSAFAQVEGGFDETGHYQYRTGPQSSPFKPTPGYEGYEQLRAQQEQMESKANQEQLRAYHYGVSSVSNSGIERLYNQPSVAVFSDGSYLTCLPPTRGNPTTYCFK